VTCNEGQLETVNGGKKTTVSGFEVLCEDTIFFPEGGGQVYSIANLFNNYFLSVADFINGNRDIKSQSTLFNPIDYLLRYYKEPYTKIKWKYASTYEIINILKSLKAKNTYGYDEISNKIMKLSTPYIVSALTFICNSALSTGVFPDRLKYAIVKPIYKKGNKQEISNYRPISLLTSFSKVFEKLIYNRLYTHLEINKILVPEQFGFRNKHSTEQAAFS
jgi:hypothetical protein